MAKDYTPHQQRIIRNYYRNLDAIRARDLLADRKVDPLPPEVEAVLAARDVEGLARLAGRE